MSPGPSISPPCAPPPNFWWENTTLNHSDLYRYLVWNGPSMNPLLRQQAWHVTRPLDLTAMRAAAKFLVGEHDFKSLAATRNYEMKSTVRTLRRCDIRRNGPLLTFVIKGDGFLYKMCRGIVGTLAQAGQGKIAPEEIRN